jgi:hypothetical protein
VIPAPREHAARRLDDARTGGGTPFGLSQPRAAAATLDSCRFGWHLSDQSVFLYSKVGKVNVTEAQRFVESFAQVWDDPDPDRFLTVFQPEIRLVAPLLPVTEGREQARDGFRSLLSSTRFRSRYGCAPPRGVVCGAGENRVFSLAGVRARLGSPRFGGPAGWERWAHEQLPLQRLPERA